MVIALTQIHHHLRHTGETFVEARKLHIHHASSRATEDDRLGHIFSRQVQTITGARAHVQGQDAVLDIAQYRNHRGRLERQGGQLEFKQLEGHGARQESLAPNVGADRALQRQVKQIQGATRNARNQSRVKDHGKDFRSANPTVTNVVHAGHLTVHIACNLAGLDVVQVRIDR